MTRPCCEQCGRKLAKYTKAIWFDYNDRPKTREEAQRRTNLPIIGLKGHYEAGGGFAYASTWDGESYGLYGEGMFCTQTCARDFGRAAYRAGYRLVVKEATA